MATLKEQLPHIALIAKAEIKKKEFSADLTNTLNSFERRYDGWWNMNKKKYEVQDPVALKSYETYTSESTLIAQHIYDYFVEESEQVGDPTIAQMATQIKEEIQGDNAPPVEPVVTPPATEPITTPEPVAIPPVEPIVPPVTPEPAKPVTPDEPEPDGKDERVLARLFKEGVTTGITKALLAEKGLDVGFWSDLTSTGMTAGKYRLIGKNGIYTLEKL